MSSLSQFTATISFREVSIKPNFIILVSKTPWPSFSFGFPSYLIHIRVDGKLQVLHRHSNVYPLILHPHSVVSLHPPPSHCHIIFCHFAPRSKTSSTQLPQHGFLLFKVWLSQCLQCVTSYSMSE